MEERRRVPVRRVADAADGASAVQRGEKPPWIVSDELWAEVEPLLPPRPPLRYRYPGRKPLDDRKVLCGILFVLCTAILWEYLPQECHNSRSRGWVPRWSGERTARDTGYFTRPSRPMAMSSCSHAQRYCFGGRPR
ncbi:transposase [Micromonospora echinospora]|uniref:transposase n=1 Tax=Micromonospora echinospora TaxID=1877 RepID=UPI003A8583DE